MGINLCGGNKMTKCWCGHSLSESFHPEYKTCVCCGTFISKKNTPSGYYDFQTYWHDKQINEYRFPPIEQRAQDDFTNRIPFWWYNIKDYNIKSVLEIGGAHGGFLHYCKQHGIEDCMGIEISEETCEYARKIFNLSMVCGEFPNVDINKRFDLVCGFDVFEHLTDPVKSLQKMKELGKYIMLQTPCYRGEGMNFPHFHGEEHLFIFTENSIRRLFTQMNIKVKTIVLGAFAYDITIVGEIA
jgi:2-polyprenyl-3-methyl-5-hydroxy-6-metoxy-1,4-benzoquinol methylase